MAVNLFRITYAGQAWSFQRLFRNTRHNDIAVNQVTIAIVERNLNAVRRDFHQHSTHSHWAFGPARFNQLGIVCQLACGNAAFIVGRRCLDIDRSFAGDSNLTVPYRMSGDINMVVGA